jgi:hypothetical protein
MRRLVGVGAWAGRAVRGLWPDHNPLRRRLDRIEAAVVGGLVVAFLAGAPLAALTVERVVWHAASGAARAEQTRGRAAHLPQRHAQARRSLVGPRGVHALALSRRLALGCRIRSRRSAAYPMVERAKTTVRSSRLSGWVPSRSCNGGR